MRRALPVVWALSAAAALVAFTSDSAPPSPETTLGSISPPSTTARTGPSSDDRPSVVRPGRAAVLASGFEVPWGLAFLPSGSALVSERDSHRIVRVDQRGRVSEVGVVPGVAGDAGEGGLLGIVLSPSFAQDALVYAYLTSPTDNRVVRMTYRDGRLSMPSVVFADIPKAAVHNGGRIAFGRDDLLYVTTGDAGERLGAPDPGHLGGKAVRMTKDGEPAPGNPIADSVVFTLGHRNPQGLVWGPDGSLYEAEFGQNALDEINLLQRGNDYGWPTVEGTLGPAGEAHTAPLLTWDTEEASPSGLAFGGDSLWVTTSNRDGRGDPVNGDDRIIRVPLTG